MRGAAGPRRALLEGGSARRSVRGKPGYPLREAELSMSIEELMMAGFGHGTRGYPRSRGRSWQRTGPDRATLGIIGTVCAVAGFFALGIILGPVAMFCGWQSMGRKWSTDRNIPAVVALVLGAIDTLLSLIALAGAATWGHGLL